MPRWKNIRELVDETHEFAAWVVLLAAFIMLATGLIGELTLVAMVWSSLITLLGTKYFSGLKVGKDGIEVSKVNNEIE